MDAKEKAREIAKYTDCNSDLIEKEIAEALTLAKEEGRKEGVTGETSDGYHTFNELYDHRCLLWINLCLLKKSKCYLIEDHFEGWFVLGMETKHGQISYHCPNKYLDLCKQIERRNPGFDGHTSKDVIARLESLTVDEGGV